MKLYGELASWWPLLSAPEDYAEEAAFFEGLLRAHAARPVRTLLELGSGGGNNASHLKAHFQLALVDPSPGMLAVSRRLNPECEHVEGDMRSVRLGRTFDGVFVHDAIVYMTTEDDLRAALATAWEHCAPGGAAVFAPDHVRENFRPSTEHGGHDGPERGLRYLAWTWDPDPTDGTYVADYVPVARSRRRCARRARPARRGALQPRDLAPADRRGRIRPERGAVRPLGAGARHLRGVRRPPSGRLTIREPARSRRGRPRMRRARRDVQEPERRSGSQCAVLSGPGQRRSG
jgi:SAM-dependent methyltransferase